MTRFTALIDGKTGAYGVVFPDLPGCTAMGRTLDETLTNAAAALRDWAEVVTARGGAVPESRPVEAIRTDPEVARGQGLGVTRSALVELMAKRQLSELV